MATLVFPLTAVRPLAEHVLAAPSVALAFGQQPDPDNVPRGLWLVKDAGVYLMSPGTPPLLAGDPAQPERRRVAYAEGYGPEDPHDLQDLLEDECGGDDFVEVTPMAVTEEVMLRPATDSLVVELTEGFVAYSFKEGGQ